MQESRLVVGQRAEIAGVEVGDGGLGVGRDGVVELNQLVEGLRQADRVALGAVGRAQSST